jgi:phage terminase large subunit
MQPKEAKQIRDRGLKDPAWFIENVLAAKPWSAQLEIIKSVRDNKETAVASCHESGKDWTAARIALAFLFTHPQSYVITTAPTFNQVKDILWQEIGMAYGGALKPLGGELLDTRLKIGPGWFMVGLATYDSTAFQGRHATSGDILVIADEAAGIESEIWVGIDGLMGSEGARLLAIGNPTDPTGPFAKMFERPSVKKIHISAFDTPNFTTFGITIEDIRSGEWADKIKGSLPYKGLVSPGWVRAMWEKWCGSSEDGEDNPLWVSRVLGDFPATGDNVLIPLSWVERSMKRWAEYPEGTPTIGGMDIARFGSDRSCIATRKGHKIMKLKVFNKQDLMVLTGALVNEIREGGLVRAYVDEPGMGGAIIDRAKELGLSKTVIGVNTGDPATDTERFLNIRAELWWMIREHLNPDETANKEPLILPPDEDLKADLVAPKYKFTSKGQIQVESKDDMKKRGLRSTDLADAVGLAILGAFRRRKKKSFIVPTVAAFCVDS